MSYPIYHVEGHNEAGYFVAERFNTAAAALKFWGEDTDWQNGEVVAEKGDGTFETLRYK